MKRVPLRLEFGSFASLALAPILIRQATTVRRTIPRLPGASGPATGIAPAPTAGTAESAPLRLVVLGESSAAGVGAADHSEAISGQTARALAACSGRSVAWQTYGQIGVTAAEAHALLLPRVAYAPADFALISLGVNDTLRMHSSRRWATDLTRLIRDLRQRIGEVPVFLAAVPPLGRFPSLPYPLRAVLGLRSRLLNQTAMVVASRLPGVTHLPITLPVTPAMFCSDGFHPGPQGYQAWGDLLGPAIFSQLQGVSR